MCHGGGASKARSLQKEPRTSSRDMERWRYGEMEMAYFQRHSSCTYPASCYRKPSARPATDPLRRASAAHLLTFPYQPIVVKVAPQSRQLFIFLVCKRHTKIFLRKGQNMKAKCFPSLVRRKVTHILVFPFLLHDIILLSTLCDILLARWTRLL